VFFSKHLWENLIKEMFMSPFISENIYQSLSPFFGTPLNFSMAWSLLNTCSTIASSDARLVANDWPCGVSWFCVTLFDFDELLVCRYDLQVGLWPNLFKTQQCQCKLFSFYLSNKTYFYVLLSTNPKTLFLMEKVFIFKIQVHQNWKWGSPLYEHLFHLTNLFYKSSFTTISPVFKIAVMWRIPPWYYSVLKKKLWEYYPRFIKVFLAIFFQKNPAWLWSF
jgi:hypothetical protein